MADFDSLLSSYDVERVDGSGGLHLRLPLRPPFHAAGLLDFLRARAVAGVESVDGHTYQRAGAELTLAGDHVAVRVHPGDPPTLPPLVAAARRLLDLDADPMAVDRALAADPVLRTLVERAPGTRLPGAWDGFEMAVRAVVGQQISVAAARTTLGRLVAACGVEGRFPHPQELLAADLTSVPLTNARRRTLEDLAAAAIPLDGSLSPDQLAAALLAIAGIGPWTASYVALRMGDTDAFPTGDSALRTAAARLGLPAGDRALLHRAERWRPWRAYAAIHLWQSLR